VLNADYLGRAEVEPKGTFVVSTVGTWTLTYTVGAYGIDDGGSILISRRPVSDARMPQFEHPSEPEYASAYATGDARIQAWYENRYWMRPWRNGVVVRVYDGSLAPGDRIVVTLGDRSGGSPGWTLQTYPETVHQFRVWVDCFGTREYYLLPEHPCITLVPGAPARVDAILPSRVSPSEEVLLRVRVLDVWDNPIPEASGEVEVTCRPEVSGSPRTFALRPGEQEVGGILFPKEGVYRVSVRVGEFSGVSNPVLVSKDARPLFWGDMHGQTRETVGTGTVAEYYRFARDRAGVDVASWQGNDFQVTDALWEEVCEETKRFHEPGRFITFLGYEWSGLTPGGGDHNIYYLKDDQPIHRSAHWQIHDGSSEETDRYPISALWETFRGRDDVMAIAHAGGRYGNFDFYDPEVVRAVEIHSHHGTFEWFAEEAMRRGMVVGIVAQSDDHTGRPGLSAPLRPLARDFATFDVYGGYTGICAEELTREGIWEALRARHCYATTGQRILLDVRCGDRMMGDVVEDAEDVRFSVRAVGTAPLLDVEVRRDAETVYRYPFPMDADAEWVRVEWSGVRVKSRQKKVDWDGEISVQGGTIEDFRAYAFDQSDQRATRVSRSELEIRSTTSGDIDGVFLKLSGDDPTISFERGPGRFSVPLGDLGTTPCVFDAGGVNQQVRFSRCTPEGRPLDVAFEFCDPDPPAGQHAYWVKVVQADGHMAWSSPVFFGG